VISPGRLAVRARRSLSHFVLSDKALAANASVFASGWRSHMQHFGSYDALSGQVGRELGLENLISGLSAEALAGNDDL
jgi:hypothetical protein